MGVGVGVAVCVWVRTGMCAVLCSNPQPISYHGDDTIAFLDDDDSDDEREQTKTDGCAASKGRGVMACEGDG